MYCSCDYYKNEGYSSFIREEWRNSRKNYKCFECKRDINIKDKYHYSCGVQENDFWFYRHCERCWDLLTWLKNNIPCYCFVYNNLFEYAYTQVSLAEDRAPEECKGLTLEFISKYNNEVARTYYSVIKNHELRNLSSKKELEILFPYLQIDKFYFDDYIDYKDQYGKCIIVKRFNGKSFNPEDEGY